VVGSMSPFLTSVSIFRTKREGALEIPSLRLDFVSLQSSFVEIARRGDQI
jgi:hypothetical protein